MSDLRDLTNALAAISASLTSIEGHVASQNANCEQLRLGLHDLRNSLQVSNLERDRATLAIRQVQTWMGDFSRKQSEIHEMVTNVQQNVHDGHRALNARIRALEPDEEVTQA
jgi:hypothetical protein